MDKSGTISDYKSKAKDRLLGNYSITVGAFVLIFAIFYLIESMLLGAYDANSAAGMAENVKEAAQTKAVSVSVLSGTVADDVAATLISVIAGMFYAVFFAGYLYILRGISYGRKMKYQDVFYGFKNHPDKLIIMYFVLSVIEIICMLPAKIAAYSVPEDDFVNGKMFFIWIVLLIVGIAVKLYFDVTFAFSTLCYLDDTGKKPTEYLKMSAKLMKGNKLRYVYIYLSLIGYFLLGIVSLGIGFLFIIPYLNMTVINMYENVKSNGEANENRI